MTQLIGRPLRLQNFHVMEMATLVSPNLSRVSADRQNNDISTSSSVMVRFDTNGTKPVQLHAHGHKYQYVAHFSEPYTQGLF